MARKSARGIISFLFLILGAAVLLHKSWRPPPTPPAPTKSPVVLQRPRDPAIPGPGAGDLTVGFWNIRDFSAASRSASELHSIAIVAHTMDCLAICELNDTIVLGKCVADLDALGGQWASVQTAAKVGNTPASAEYYGFVYRSDKLKVRAPPRTLPDLDCPVPGEARPHSFDRDPAACSFATLDGHFDFTLIVVHITWGKEVAYRKAEIRALKNYFVQVRDADPGDKDVILCGDFNRDVGDPDALTELLALPTMIDTTDPAIPTMIGTDHTYDHLLFQARYVTEYSGRHGVDRFDEVLFGNDDARAKKACSDHRPIWAVFKVPERDDD